MKAGIPVPPGFVILSSAFEHFLRHENIHEKIDAILHTVDHQKMHTVEGASEQIKAVILSTPVPKYVGKEILTAFTTLQAPYVAVRSSATAEDSSTAAWAGQLESYLNTTKEDLLENVKKCWASLFTPRAIFYRFEKNLHEQHVSVAVVVQKMVESEVSGIAFSVHPVTQDHNQLIIEAGLGLGEAIVSGQITPDSYVVEKKKFEIIEKKVTTQTTALYRSRNGGNEWKKNSGNKQKLSDLQIIKLAKLVVKIEQHYGFPVDVEWALKKERFYVVQSRPITTLLNQSQQKFDLNISKYQRLFQLNDLNVYYLISDIFMDHYKTWGTLLTYRKGTWTTYLPNSTIEHCLNEGLKLFKDARLFNRYETRFSKYIGDYTDLLKKLILKTSITEKEAKRVFELAPKFFYYYSQTEFFYTDKAFIASKKNEALRDNLNRLEQIKNPGREAMNKLFFGEQSYFYRFLVVLAKQWKIKPKVLFAYYTRQEILDIYSTKVLPKKKINSRKTAYIMKGDNGNLITTEGQSADNLISRIGSELRKKIETKHELKGITANPGNVKGRVKIIHSDYYHDRSKLSKYFAEMNDGDVLVAETTSPELIPACKKAAAILTNQGGLLSHAAIISRELGIPCIVGLENITSLVKDGDFVEVDANNGIVKILKK